MPISLSRGANGAFPALLLKYYAKLITEVPVEEIRPSVIGHTIVRREAVGVVAAVDPVELPAGTGRDEDRAGAGRGLHGGPQGLTRNRFGRIGFR